MQLLQSNNCCNSNASSNDRPPLAVGHGSGELGAELFNFDICRLNVFPRGQLFCIKPVALVDGSVQFISKLRRIASSAPNLQKVRKITVSILVDRL